MDHLVARQMQSSASAPQKINMNVGRITILGPARRLWEVSSELGQSGRAVYRVEGVGEIEFQDDTVGCVSVSGGQLIDCVDSAFCPLRTRDPILAMARNNL